MKLLNLTFLLTCVASLVGRALGQEDAFAQTTPRLIKGSIVVDDKGTKLGYTDSGAPLTSRYTTIFAVHGQGFNGEIYERVQARAYQQDLRLVAVTRRGYAGSTLYSAEEARVLNNGTASENTAFQAARGLELISFIDKFIQQERISLSSGSDIAISGWSLGNTVTLSAVQNFNSAPEATRKRLGPYIKTMILHEPSSNVLGLPVDPRNWVPWTVVDATINPANQVSFFSEWVAGYFQHGDLSKRNPDVLSFQSHALGLRPPSVYNMFSSGHRTILEGTGTFDLEVAYQLRFNDQLLASYKSLFDRQRLAALPQMKSFLFGGENSPAYAPFTTWLIQDDDKAHGGGFIKAKLVKGINHMSAWDDPDITINLFKDCITRVF